MPSPWFASGYGYDPPISTVDPRSPDSRAHLPASGAPGTTTVVTWRSLISGGLELVVGKLLVFLEHGMDFFFHLNWEWNVIIPIDELIFFRGVETTNQGAMDSMIKTWVTNGI